MKNILLSILILFPLFGFTQKTFFTETSSPYKVIDGKRKAYFYHENFMLSVKIEGETVYFQKTNTNTLELLINNEEDLPSGAVVESVFELNNKYYLFYSLWDSPNEQLFFREIDFNQATFKTDTKKIITVDHHLTRIPIDYIIGFWGYDITSKFHFKISADSSKLLIQYRYLREKRIDAINHDVIGLNVFDQNINLLWQNEVTMTYTEKQMDFLDHAVDQNGNVYLLASVFNDNTTRQVSKEGNLNYRVELLIYNAKTAEQKEPIPIDIDRHLINSIRFNEVYTEQVSISGFYGDDVYSYQSKGMFTWDYNIENHDSKIHYYNFPDDFLQKASHFYDPEISMEDNLHDDLSDYKVMNKFSLKNGNTIYICEQHFIITHTYYSKTGKHDTHFYHYNNIAVFNIDPTGKLNWVKVIPKNQVGNIGKGAMSFKYFTNDKNLYILFFDDIDNEYASPNETLYTYKDNSAAILTAYKISYSDGALTRIPILNTEDFDGLSIKQFYTNRILYIGNNEFVLEAYKKKKEDILIKVGFIE